MKIRKGKISDLKELFRILISTKELQGGNFEIGDYDKVWVKSVLTKTKENFVLIAEEEKEMVGFIIAHILISVSQVIINDVYVNPAHRNKGIASSLIKEAEKIARKNKIKYFTGFVQTSNKKMQKLKQKLNFGRGESLYYYEKVLK
jgi:ribosomal protein S18 acetylase RimI-like enzyme